MGRFGFSGEKIPGKQRGEGKQDNLFYTPPRGEGYLTASHTVKQNLLIFPQIFRVSVRLPAITAD